MVFNVIHGVDAKDPSTVMTPFNFDRNIKLAKLRIGVDPNAPKEFVDKLRELGMKPTDIGARPTVPGIGGGGLNVEYAAAFDDYVQRKAKEIGLDLNTVVTATPGGAPFPGSGQAAPVTPMSPADWNPRFVNGRTVKAFEFMQNQRRRYVLITKWGEFMKDLDMFIGAPAADIAPNAQTGHPCVVVPYKFDVPVQQQGGRGGANPGTHDAAAGAAQSTADLRRDHRRALQRRQDSLRRASVPDAQRRRFEASGVVAWTRSTSSRNSPASRGSFSHAS
jgi:hypothetical protein